MFCSRTVEYNERVGDCMVVRERPCRSRVTRGSDMCAAHLGRLLREAEEKRKQMLLAEETRKEEMQAAELLMAFRG